MTIEKIRTMTEEERKRELEWSDPYEFGTIYAEYLLEEKQKLIDYLKEQINYIKTNFSQVNGNYFMLNDRLDVYEEILSKIERR